MEMNREYISEHNVVERYLTGRLSDEELAAFEERCLWDHEVLDELEAAERLREGLRDFDAGAAQSAPRGPLARWLLSPQWAAAASVLLVVSLATTGQLLLTRSPSSDVGLATARVYSIEMTRGADEASATVRVGPADEWVVLLVYPDMERHERFQANLYRAGESRAAWQANDISAGTGESLAVTLPAALLTPGAYRLQVIGMQDSDIYSVQAGGSRATSPGAPVGEVHFRVASGD
jgi:hypothetical protein